MLHQVSCVYTALAFSSVMYRSCKDHVYSFVLLLGVFFGVLSYLTVEFSGKERKQFLLIPWGAGYMLGTNNANVSYGSAIY